MVIKRMTLAIKINKVEEGRAVHDKAEKPKQLRITRYELRFF